MLLFRMLFITLLSLSSIHISAQWLQQKYNQQNDQLPTWIQLMYSDTADVLEVIKAYEEYYETHSFQKNQYTQYFKRWVRQFGRSTAWTYMSPKQRHNYRQHKEAYIQKSLQLQQNRASNSSWQGLGPFDFDKDANESSYAAGAAHVYTVEKSKSQPNTLYAGTATAGVWRSIDNGQNWLLMTRQILMASVRSIEIDHSNSDIVYVASDADGKVYKTIDGGNNWALTGDPTFNSLEHEIGDIVMHPVFTNIVFLASSEGLYRSVNGGSTWGLVQAGIHQEIEFHPTDPTIVYTVQQIGIETRFYKSTNSGLNFTQKSIGWPAPNIGALDEQKRTEIAVSPADSSRVYALATGQVNGGTGLYGVYVSTDEGETWTFNCCGPQPAGPASLSNQNLMGWNKNGTDNGGQYYYDLALAVSPTNADSVFVGGVNLWISGNGGASFTCPSAWSESQNPNYVHADIHDIRFMNNELWIACDGGIFYSDNNAAQVDRKMYGIQGTDFWGFGAGFRDGEVMLGGTYHNGTLLKDNNVYNNGWLSTDGGDNYRGYVNPSKPRIVYSDYNKKELPGDRLQPFKTFDFDKNPYASYVIGQSAQMKFHPHNYNTVYSPEYYWLWKSENDGKTWEQLADFGSGILTSFEIAWDNPQVMYIAYQPSNSWGTRKIFRSNDGGYNWSDITPPVAILNGDEWVAYELTIHPEDSNTIWAARVSRYDGYPNLDGHQIYKSIDGGQNWVNVTTADLDGEYITNIEYIRGSNDGIYVGTRRAVYYKNNSMPNWTLFNNNLPFNTTSINLIPYYKEAKLRNGTNRSVYEVDFYEKTPPHAQIAVDKFQSGCMRDTFYFVDYSALHSNGTRLWSFPGGTPSSSTDEAPKVVYSQTGSYTVSLTVTDSLGTDSQTLTQFIQINNDCAIDTIPGYALNLNSNNDYVSIPPLNISTNNITFSAWIKPDSIQADYTGIVNLNSSGDAASLNLRVNNELGYHWPGGSWAWSSGLYVPSNEWSHVVLSVTPDSVSVYLNGVRSTHHTTTLASDMNDELFIGRDRNWFTRTFKGQIDEVAIWNRALFQDEIRAHRHLVKYQAQHPDLLHYYQFNSLNSKIQDRVGTAHADFIAAAARINSSAPIGGGTSHKMQVNTAGQKDFTGTNLNITFPNTGSYPNGELVATRLNVAPDYLADSNLVSNGYWIVNNYGNASFSPLTAMQFSNIGTISNADANNPAVFNLFKRPSNVDGNTWGSFIDEADIATAGSLGDITFSTGLGVSNFSQFMISNDSANIITSTPLKENILPQPILVYPNPNQVGYPIQIKTVYNTTFKFKLYNALGKKVLEQTIANGQGQCSTIGLASGSYFYQLVGDKWRQQGKLILIK
ncbi:MAG: T9SS type A sorting domain-containing protein [Aureispira sp.]|nr:T9SS type A sorting domain-containing protein [Aureispira sp.]